MHRLLAPVRHPCTRALSLACALALLGIGARAKAGNDDGVLLGNEAAITAGAVTATVTDGSALWYNPAGLAGSSDADAVDVTASAFVLRHYRIPNLLSSNRGEGGDGSFTEVVTIPSALTFLRKLRKDLTLGLGLFSPQSNDYVLRSSLSTLGNIDMRWSVLTASKQSQYYAAIGLGYAITPQVFLGATLMGAYASGASTLQVSGAVDDGGTGDLLAFSVQSQRDAYTALGMEARLGLMVRPVRAWSVGMSLQLPGLTVFTSYRSQGVLGSSSPDMPGGANVQAFAPIDDEKSGGNVAIYSPMRGRFSVAYRLPRGGSVALDGDLASRMKNSDLELNRRVTWNVRVGGMTPVTERLSLGGGLFTDRGPERPGPGGTGPIDFYGFTLGGQYATVRRLDPREKRETLTLSTTAALRYAHGVAKTDGFYVDADTGETSTPAVPLRVDEIGLHLGSSMRF